MLEHLKNEANRTYTENGALTHATTFSDCLDLFATIGALRSAEEQQILSRFVRAFTEDPDLAMKTLFFARDVRGGLGERKVFRVCLRWLACNAPGSARKNIPFVAEFGRWDKLPLGRSNRKKCAALLLFIKMKGVITMIEVVGQYNTAICYTGALEDAAAEQIKAVCDQPAFADCKIRIMPDVHAGMGCTIGTTMTITDKIVPGMVGVDIGCGMETVRIAEKEIDFTRLDEIVHKYIPCGREVRNQPHKLNDQIDLTQLRCSPYVNLERARRSIGTLGGGNHFIEVDRGENGDLYIVVHSGSRHIGNEVAKYYQDEGRKAFWGGARHQVDAAVAELKAQGRFQEIQPTIDRLREEHEIALPKDLAYVEGRLFDDYIHDMKIIQHFATLNRKAMMDVILVGMRLTAVEQFTTIHNYIDTDNMILRKGAVAAYAGQKLLIPINMRDGSLICIGKGSPDWNCSAPHGAGRLVSRKEAFKRLSLEEYRKEMEGIYTTCVDRTTLDEAPMAYKGMDEIISHIGPTVQIVERITPVYNFKAAE